MSHKVNFNKISCHVQPEHSPGYLLWQVSTAWRRSLEQLLKNFGLTHPQFVVLSVTGWLTQAKEGVTQVKIGKMAGLDPNTNSQVIRGLEGKKLLQRTPAVDGRAKQVALTQEGAKLLKLALPAVEKEDKVFFSKLSEGEMLLLKGMFLRLGV